MVDEHRAAMPAKRQPAQPSATADWVRALQRTATISPDSSRTLVRAVDEVADRNMRHPALVGETEALSYGELAEMSNRCARWALVLGLQKGERVALLMENRPAYAAIWLGLSRVGLVTALLNTQVVGAALVRSVATAGARHVIVGTSHAERVPDLLAAGLQVWSFDSDVAECGRMNLAAVSGAPVTAAEARPVLLRDPALLIYTSGTTGLPKAAYVSHFRILMWSEWFAGIMDARPNDRLYDCLPMYHAVGGVVAVGAMLAAGGTVLVRRGFSASRFWPDLAQSGATIFQYIGELCRYLAAAPKDDMEQAHSLRLCCGNGLRADVWTAFAERFAVPRIIEFYAATEGSFSLFNLEGKPGAIGRIPPFMAHRSPVALVRHDVATERPLRDENGFCVVCAPGEPGEAIGRLSEHAAGLSTSFDGYTSADETDRKILKDVFAPGDRWFRTGDLMTRDRLGFFFFIDRIGDTFRWKGENVSTLEVADVLCACPGVADATVYGVSVANVDGRAGMGALVVDETFDWATLQDHVQARLPRYARPVFVRLLTGLDTTATFRLKKLALAEQGYSPASASDPLYLLEDGTYRPLDEEMLRRISAGEIRL